MARFSGKFIVFHLFFALYLVVLPQISVAVPSTETPDEIVSAAQSGDIERMAHPPFIPGGGTPGEIAGQPPRAADPDAPVPVPEPGTLFLLSAGLGLLCLAAWRRQGRHEIV